MATSEAELETRREYARQVEKKLALERTLHASEFKLLQSQISPHFLFNTLNLLMRTAYREGAPQTADLICDLADLLRRAYYYKDSICTLAEEMQCARQYLTLQSQRLGPGFSFEVGDVSACGQLMIPVLTIQPLVENAILHGAGEDEHPLHVKVSATAEDGKLVISVSDNGAGIPEEVLEKLRDHQAGGSGVQNVTERLKLFFGPEAEVGGGFTLLGGRCGAAGGAGQRLLHLAFQAVCRGRGHPDPVRISVHRGRGAFAADGTVLRRYAAAFHRAVPSAAGDTWCCCPPWPRLSGAP